MKQIITTFIIAIFIFSSCNNKQTETQGTLDLAGKKELLKTKKNEAKALKKEISDLESEIEKIDPNMHKKTTVTSLVVSKMDFKRFTEIQGIVESSEIVKVSAEIPGRLLNIYVDNGDRVRKGQLIAKVDVEDIQKSLDEVETSYQHAKDLFERQDRLWKKNIGSEMQFLSAKNNKERLEKGIASIKHQLKKANIYAPASGVVDNKNIEAGEMVSPGFPLFKILNTSKMKVTADVPETYLSTVKYGDIISIKIPALNIDTQGKISRIGNTINPANRTFSIEIRLNNHKNVLKPNLLALVLLNDYSEEDVVVIPSELIQHEISGKPFVMLAKKNKDHLIAKKNYIKTGEEYNGQTVVVEGIVANDNLINKGARSLSDEELIEFEIEK